MGGGEGHERCTYLRAVATTQLHFTKLRSIDLIVESLLEIIDWTRLDSIDPIENDKEARLETIKLIDFCCEIRLETIKLIDSYRVS